MKKKTFSKICAIMMSSVLVLPMMAYADTPDTNKTEGNNIMKEYFVDINGSDSNQGTEAAPLKTIAKARDMVRSEKGTMSGDIIIHIGEGEYVLDSTLELTSDDSGNNGYNIIYDGAGKDKTVISGGETIDGFTMHDASKNIYKASVPAGLDFRQLYVNGTKVLRARSGNTDSFSTRIKGAERIKDGVVLPELLTNNTAEAKQQADDGTIFLHTSDNTFNEAWSNLTDVELHVFTAWSTNVLRVKSAVKDGDTYNIKVQDEEAELLFNRQHPNIDGYSYMNTHEFIYYVENAYELIDTDNEWYLDTATNTLYYKAPAGMNMSEAKVVAPKLETVVKVNGTLDKNVENVKFQNMSFQYTTWMKPSTEGFVDGQAMQYVTTTIFADNNVAVGRPAAGVLVVGAKNVTFDNNEFKNMGATAIDMCYGDTNCTISNNSVHNISGNGISVGKFVETDSIDFHVPYNPADAREVCDGINVVNNSVEYIGTDYECAVGIACGYPKNILIANNTVAYAPYSGISVGFGWTVKDNAMSGNRILRNEIHHVTDKLCDAGGIYTLSAQPNSELVENYVHDIKLVSWADYDTCGLYMDEGTAGYVIEENIIEKAKGVNLHATGVNYVSKNYENQGGNVTGTRQQEIKDNAGVQTDFDITKLPEKRKTPDEQDPTNGAKLETVFGDDFNGYAEGKLDSSLWTVSDIQKNDLNFVNVDGNNVLKITSHSANTKVYNNTKLGNYVATFDFNFIDTLSNADGMYNVVRKANKTYTANITPAHSTTVRLENKGVDEVGKLVSINSAKWYTCKTVVSGDTIYIKVWEKGTTEPEKWDVTRKMDDNINNDGFLGFEYYAGNKSMYVDNVLVQSITNTDPGASLNPDDKGDAGNDANTVTDKPQTGDSKAGFVSALMLCVSGVIIATGLIFYEIKKRRKVVE